MVVDENAREFRLSPQFFSSRFRMTSVGCRNYQKNNISDTDKLSLYSVSHQAHLVKINVFKLKLQYKDRKKWFFLKITIYWFHSLISFSHENAFLRRRDAPGRTIICKRGRGKYAGVRNRLRAYKKWHDNLLVSLMKITPLAWHVTCVSVYV